MISFHIPKVSEYLTAEDVKPGDLIIEDGCKTNYLYVGTDGPVMFNTLNLNTLERVTAAFARCRIRIIKHGQYAVYLKHDPYSPKVRVEDLKPGTVFSDWKRTLCVKTRHRALSFVLLPTVGWAYDVGVNKLSLDVTFIADNLMFQELP